MKPVTALLMFVAIIALVSFDLYDNALHQQAAKEERAKRDRDSQAEAGRERDETAKVVEDIATAHKDLTDRDQADLDQIKTLGHFQITDAEREKRVKLDALRTHYIRSLQDHWYDMTDEMRVDFKQKYEADKQAIEDGDGPAASDDSH